MFQLSEVHRRLQGRMEDLVAREVAPHASAIEGGHQFPEPAYRAFARQRLFALALPRSHGGEEADALGLGLMVEAIATVSPSAALLVFPSNAALRTIARTGSAEQKERLFAELKQGDQPLAFCLTEPGHGSDAAGIITRAERQDGHYVVNGVKSFITLGPHARYYLTFVRTGPGARAAGLSALLIPRDTPGLAFGPPERKMGLNGSVTTQMYLDGCRVPVENRLWGEGEGWRVLTEVCNPMRVWGAAALALGAAQGLLNAALAHARQEAALGGQAVAFACADMKMRVEACRALVYHVCSLVDRAADARQVETMVSAAKCLASDTAMQVAHLAGEVIGPDMAREDHPAARLFCSAKGIQIFDGSNQVQRMIIARNLAKGL